MIDPLSTPPVTDEDDLIPRFKRWMMNTGYDGGDQATSPPKRLLAAYEALLADHTALQAAVEEAREALRPFAAIAQHDIGDDEEDADLYRPMTGGHNRAPLPIVGDFRKAANFLAKEGAR